MSSWLGPPAIAPVLWLQRAQGLERRRIPRSEARELTYRAGTGGGGVEATWAECFLAGGSGGDLADAGGQVSLDAAGEFQPDQERQDETDDHEADQDWGKGH